MNPAERIITDPTICHGKPVLRGLRYPVETIAKLLAAGMTSEEILADYKDLEHEDIEAVTAFGKLRRNSIWPNWSSKCLPIINRVRNPSAHLLGMRNGEAQCTQLRTKQ